MPDRKIPSLFLCLSGGGFRASLFHYGCLRRLHEAGLLGKVYAISATSGGAIVAALLALCHKGIDKNSGHHEYDWARFEKLLFGLATRGVLGPVFRTLLTHLLYVLAVAAWFMPLPAGPGLPWSLLLAGAAIVLHVSVIRDLWYRPDPSIARLAKLRGGSVVTESWIRRLMRTVGTTFRPSRVRLEILNARAFRKMTLGSISQWPRIYLNAVDLNSGREAAFSQGVTAIFDSVGCRALYEGRSSRDQHQGANIEVAAAVAASTAFPPVFLPVAVRNGDQLKGVFADGGVLDNFAIKLPESMAAHIHPDRGQRYSPDAGGIPSFGQRTRYVLIMDGSQTLAQKHKRAWSRPRALLRIISAMTGEHGSDAEIAATNLERNVGIGSGILGLRMGFPDDDELSALARRVRTHMDAFSTEECAVLAWCGYSQASYLLAHSTELFTAAGTDPGGAGTPCLFADILPASAGEWSTDAGTLRRKLRVSHQRTGWLRSIRRVTGI